MLHPEKSDFSPSAEMTEIAKNVLELGMLAIRLANVYRVPKYSELRRENDAEHSFMLALIAPLIAEKYCSNLDSNLVGRLAIVHDLVEVEAGDTPTLKIDEHGLAEKHKKEQLALHKLKETFGDKFPELIELIELYESCSIPEARFVKVIDKMMPSITHFTDKAQTLKDEYDLYSWDDIWKFVRSNTIKTSEIAYDQDFAVELRYAMYALVRDELILK